MTGWRDLAARLDAVAEKGGAIRFWWRDDDAGRGHPALDRLLELAAARALPVALAVVPDWLEASVQARIAASAEATVLQHGYCHRNHAPPGSKSVELTGDPERIGRQLRRGRALLTDAFGAAFCAVLVPPWNRLDRDLIARLPDWGFRGLSLYGRRVSPWPVPGLALVNTHVDPVDWHGTRGFLGEAAALDQLRAVLDADEPIGILTHHLVMDEPGWEFLDRLFDVLAHHPGVRFCAAGELFEAPE